MSVLANGTDWLFLQDLSFFNAKECGYRFHIKDET